MVRMSSRRERNKYLHATFLNLFGRFVRGVPPSRLGFLPSDWSTAAPARPKSAKTSGKDRVGAKKERPPKAQRARSAAW